MFLASSLPAATIGAAVVDRMGLGNGGASVGIVIICVVDVDDDGGGANGLSMVCCLCPLVVAESVSSSMWLIMRLSFGLELLIMVDVVPAV